MQQVSNFLEKRYFLRIFDLICVSIVLIGGSNIQEKNHNKQNSDAKASSYLNVFNLASWKKPKNLLSIAASIGYSDLVSFRSPPWFPTVSRRIGSPSVSIDASRGICGTIASGVSSTVRLFV